MGTDEGFVCPLEDSDSRKVISQTQLLHSCGDEPDLQCERGWGGGRGILKMGSRARYHYYRCFQIKPVH